MHRLNVLGCGKAGRALTRLFFQQRVFTIGDVVNRSLDSTRAAVAFVGSGTALDAVRSMQPARLWMIGTGDDSIPAMAETLASSGALHGGDIVFHVSGATPAQALAPCATAGALIASIHPVKNFSDPAASVASFPGTWCGCEGDPPALDLLRPAFARLGARLFDIDARYKAIYHGGGAFACNFLPVLMELALRCEEKAGLTREVALAMFEPIARETMDAIFRQGIAPALAGPISRGDAGTVGRHLAAMGEWSPPMRALYASLGTVALELVESLGRVEHARIDATRRVMREAIGDDARDAWSNDMRSAMRSTANGAPQRDA